MKRWFVLGLCWAGCYAPNAENGGLECSAGGDCPAGYACGSDHHCWLPGTGPQMTAPSEMPDLAPPPAVAPPADLAMAPSMNDLAMAAPMNDLATAAHDLSTAPPNDLATADLSPQPTPTPSPTPVPSPMPTTITGPTDVGAGDQGLVASVPAQSQVSYVWTIADGTITGGQGTNQITFTAGNTGTLTLSVAVSNASGKATAKDTITVRTPFTVTSINDSGPDTLRDALTSITGHSGNYLVRFTAIGMIRLQTELPPLNGSANIVFVGSGTHNLTVDGNGRFRIFFVDTATVVLRHLTLAEGLVVAGNGGNGAGAGGGAAGMGGAIFLNSGAVTVDDVIFDHNSVAGGKGGDCVASSTLMIGGGGGGGFGGAGASAMATSTAPPTGGAAGPAGDLSGGAGGAGTSSSVDGTPNGGFGAGGGGGGSGWTTTSCTQNTCVTAFAGPGPGGAGGFGGGGGGGGIGAVNVGGLGANGTGGTFGGNGTCAGSSASGSGHGGGGAGLGGGIFVRAGTLTILGASFIANSTKPGDGGTRGLAKGGSIFIASGATATGFANCTFTGSVAPDAAGTAGDTIDVYGTIN